MAKTWTETLPKIDATALPKLFQQPNRTTKVLPPGAFDRAD